MWVLGLFIHAPIFEKEREMPTLNQLICHGREEKTIFISQVFIFFLSMYAIDLFYKF